MITHDVSNSNKLELVFLNDEGVGCQYKYAPKLCKTYSWFINRIKNLIYDFNQTTITLTI